MLKKRAGKEDQSYFVAEIFHHKAWHSSAHFSWILHLLRGWILDPIGLCLRRLNLARAQATDQNPLHFYLLMYVE